MSAFPPHRSIPSIPVSQAIALQHLQSYLEATSNLPYLLPNARLEPSGPTAGSGSNSITIHNLKRVEAGLRGEWLAPVLDLYSKNYSNGATTEVPVATGMDDGIDQEEGDKMGVEGWQDADEYAREQTVEEGDIAPTSTVVAQQGDAELETAEAPEPEKRKLENGAATGNEVKDKKARKEAKKLRAKESKKQREAERLKKKGSE